MRMDLVRFSVAILFLSILWIIPGHAAQPVSSASFEEDSQAYQEGPPEPLLDDLFDNVAARVPAFGGMFLEGSVLKVWVTNMGVRSAVEDAIREVFGSERIPSGGLQLLQGQFGFQQLKAWHNRLGPLFQIEGVVLTDVDETLNRLKVGVANSILIAAVQQEALRLGIPANALVLVQVSPITIAASLTDQMRPIKGGIQIAFSSYVCTLGFNALRGGTQGFVTNSHCTNTQGGVESTSHYQPSVSAQYLIGTEIADPTYTAAKCSAEGLPSGYVCRYSDSAFSQLQSGVTADLGLIARPTGLGSLTIAGTFQVVNEGSSIAGQTLNKVGRTTGWSQGSVTQTCVHVQLSGTNIVQLCQDLVSASVGPGDSGSPVFSITNAQNDAQLRGILWGGTLDGTSFVYSPIANIQRNDELGELTTEYTQPFDFSLSNSGGITAIQGGAGANTITATLLSGNTQAVLLSCTSGLPAGASCLFVPDSGSPTFSSTLTITTSLSTPACPSTVTVTGTGGGVTRTTSFTLTVTPSGGGEASCTSLQLTASPTPVIAGNPVTFTAVLSGVWRELSGKVSGKQIVVSGWGNSGSCTTGANGVCQVTMTSPATEGTYPVGAQFAGDTNFGPSAASLNLQVTPSGIKISATIKVNSYPGTFRLRVANLNNIAVCIKQQDIAKGQTATLTCIVNAETYKVEVYRYTSRIYGPVTVTVPPDYLFNINYATSPGSPIQPHVLTLDALAGQMPRPSGPLSHSTATTSLSLAASPNPVIAGNPVTFTIALGGTWHELTGVVSGKLVVVSGWGQSGSCTTNSNGQCQLTLTSPATEGTYPVSADFAGDANFAASNVAMNLSVSPAGIRIQVTIKVNSYPGTFRLRVANTNNIAVCIKQQDIAKGQTAILTCIVNAGTYKVEVYRYTSRIYGPVTVTVPPDFLFNINYSEKPSGPIQPLAMTLAVSSILFPKVQDRLISRDFPAQDESQPRPKSPDPSFF